MFRSIRFHLGALIAMALAAWCGTASYGPSPFAAQTTQDLQQRGRLERRLLWASRA